MEDRERLNQLVNELNLYKEQAEILNQQMETVQANIADITIARKLCKPLRIKRTLRHWYPLVPDHSS